MIQKEKTFSRTCATAETNSKADLRPPEPTHIIPLDGLRGLAILLVMARHFIDKFEVHTQLDNIVYQVARLGSNGVDLFFVLSGFLITGILLDTKGRPNYFRRFYIRRTVRIFPLYYLSLAVIFYIWPLFSPEYSYVIQEAPEYSAWYWLYGTNILFAIHSEYIGLVHFWSLAVEEQFYFIWPIVVLACTSKGLFRMCIGAIIGAFALRIFFALTVESVIPPYVLTPTRMDALAVGGLLAVLARNPGGLQRFVIQSRWLLGLSIVFLFLLFASTFGQGRSHLVNIAGGSIVALLFGSLVLITIGGPPEGLASRVFSWRVLRFFGKYAYCLYVVHLLVKEVIEKIYSDDLVPAVMGSYLPGRALGVLLFTIGSVVIALLSWHLYEKQWLKLKRFS